MRAKQLSLPIKKSKSVIEGAWDLPVNIKRNGLPNTGNLRLFSSRKLSMKTPIRSLSLKFTSLSSFLNFKSKSGSIFIWDINFLWK